MFSANQKTKKNEKVVNLSEPLNSRARSRRLLISEIVILNAGGLSEREREASNREERL